MSFYDDPRFGVRQNIHLGTSKAANTSVIGTRVEIARKTLMEAVKIKDWNISVRDGCTCTGGINFNVALSKSLAGTGAVTPFGSHAVGTAADTAILDAAVTTEQSFAAGDDIVLSYEVGTALPAGTLQVEADVSYVETYS